jgi:2-iminobutanoate/2-iminopropanoate deaminase
MATEMKSVIRTENAPAPFQGAPYSQAIRAGEFIFVSGQLGLKPDQAEIGGSIEEQTEQIFANLAAILAEAGTGLDRLVKTTVFLTDLGDFAGMNEVYARHVGGSPPARSTVEVAALPSGAKVEIEAIAGL